MNESLNLMHARLGIRGGGAQQDRMIKDNRQSIGLYNEYKKLPEKDFKGRFSNNILKEVSVELLIVLKT